MTVQLNSHESNWVARLELSFTGRADKTVLSHRKSFGPLVVQKPFYPEGDVCHVYVLHPPGGIVGGDEIQLDIDALNIVPEDEADVERGDEVLPHKTHALITTPGAAKFYRSKGLVARVRQNITIGNGAVVEWLPQETIYFDQSFISSKTKINLEKGATFLGWEIGCFGRPASDEYFLNGQIQQAFEIWRDGRPLFVDRSHLVGGDDVFSASWGLQNYRTSGIFILTSASDEMCQVARAALQALSDEGGADEGGIIGISLIGDVLICRGLAHQAEWMKKRFIRIWQTLRPHICEKEAVLPRIWAT